MSLSYLCIGKSIGVWFRFLPRIYLKIRLTVNVGCILCTYIEDLNCLSVVFDRRTVSKREIDK